MSSEQQIKLPDDLWNDFNETKGHTYEVEPSPTLSPDLINVPTDDPESRILFAPLKLLLEKSETSEPVPKGEQQFTAFALDAAVDTVREVRLWREARRNKEHADTEPQINYDVILLDQIGHTNLQATADIAQWGRRFACKLKGVDFDELGDTIHARYNDDIDIPEADWPDWVKIFKGNVYQDVTLGNTIDACVELIGNNKALCNGIIERKRLARLAVCTALTQIDHWQAVQSLEPQILEHTDNDKIDEMIEGLLATKSASVPFPKEANVEARQPAKLVPIFVTKKYKPTDLISISLDDIEPEEPLEADLIEQNLSELQTLILKSQQLRELADKQMSNGVNEHVRIFSSIALRQANFIPNASNLLIAHRARHIAFLIANVSMSQTTYVSSAYRNDVGTSDEEWPQVAEQMVREVLADPDLSEKLDACLPVITENPKEYAVARAIICTTLRQIHHWQQAPNKKHSM